MPPVNLHIENRYFNIKTSVVFDAVIDAIMLFVSGFALLFSIANGEVVWAILNGLVFVYIIIKRIVLEWKERKLR